MASCREVLTLQLGTAANYVGTHWWNSQEASFQYDPKQKSSLCHDVLYREGHTIRGEVTFTPRTIFVDSALRSVPVSTIEDNGESGPILWDTNKVEKVDSIIQEPHQFIKDLDAGEDVSKKNYDFEKSLRGWADFLKTRLHPRSILFGYRKDNDEVEERVRSYVEECDNLQGFQILLDTSDSFTEILSYLEDEFSSKTRLSFPILGEFFPERQWRDAARRVIRTFLSFHDTASLSTLTVPISCIDQFAVRLETSRAFPHLNYEPRLQYHTAAILASFLDSISLPYRNMEKGSRISDVVNGLTMYGWTFSAASLTFPFPIAPQLTLQETLEARDDELPLWTCITPATTIRDTWYQSLSLRGLQDNGVFLQYLQYLSSTLSTVHNFDMPFHTATPFPQIFAPCVSTKGSVDLTAERADGFHVSSCAVLGGLHACPGLGEMLSTLTSEARGIDLRRLPELEVECDNWESNLDSMFSTSKRHSVLMDVE